MSSVFGAFRKEKTGLSKSDNIKLLSLSAFAGEECIETHNPDGYGRIIENHLVFCHILQVGEIMSRGLLFDRLTALSEVEGRPAVLH